MPFPCCCGGGSEGRKRGMFADAYDDEHDDHQDSIKREQQINLHSKAKPKRKIVCAKPIDVTEEFVAPHFPKSEAEIKTIDEALSDNFIFSDLSPEERLQLIDAMQKEEVDEGTEIITQGDEESEFFYIVADGRVLFIADGMNVGSCSRGGSFGELALLYNSPRAATCLAETKCKLWKVDQDTFRHMLARNAREQEKNVTSVVGKIPLLSALDPSDTCKFADSLTRIKFYEGDRIVNKGDDGEVFYIIQSGTVKCHDIGLGDSQIVDQILKAGDWFGERALLTGEPRAANVTALSECVMLCVSRDMFEKAIGCLDTIVDRGMKKRFLLGLPLFANSAFESSEMDQLVELVTEQCFRKGDKLAEIGQPYRQELWIIRNGRILVVSSTGKLFTLLSGDYFGDKSIKAEAGRISSHDAIVEENTTCWVLSRADLEKVIGDINRLGDVMPFVPSAINQSINLSHIKKHRILGMGAFGKVWLVSHKKTGTPYALKMMDKRKLIRAHQVKGVTREKNIMQSLEHPLLLHLVSSFQDDDSLYLLLELVQGGELFNVVHTDKKKGIPNHQACFYAACIVEVLGHMHQRKICYRDLKPENVLIDSKGYCVLVDLGFAKIVVDKTYTLCGTPEYIAPEIILSKGHDKAVDYWSFGVLVYELLAGQSPFFYRGIDQASLFKRILMVQYKCSSAIGEDAQDLIEKLLVRRQASRLGNLSRGHRDIKDHAWFKNIDFKKLVKKEIPAPWLPVIKDPFDASHFDDFRYAEHDDVPHQTPLGERAQALFKDF